MTSERRSIVVTHRVGYKSRLTAFILVTGFVGLALGYWFGAEDLAELSGEHKRLNRDFNVVQAELTENKGQLEILRLNREVDLAAIENSRQEMIAVQQQIINGQEELALYRELLGDVNQSSGLSVTKVSLTSLGGPRFGYHWVARQKTSKMLTSKVIAKLFIVGSLDGRAVSLPLDQVDQQVNDMPLNLNFKYFSINQGVFGLPDRFIPAKVRITLRYGWEKNDSYDQSFDWKIED